MKLKRGIAREGDLINSFYTEPNLPEKTNIFVLKGNFQRRSSPYLNWLSDSTILTERLSMSSADGSIDSTRESFLRELRTG